MKMMLFALMVFLLTIKSGFNDMIGDQKKNEIYKKLVDDSRFDLDYLYKEYLKVCPYDLQCPDYRPGTTNVDGEVFIDEGTFSDSDWFCNNNCSCQPDCIFNNECCPNVIYGYLRYTCVDAAISLDTDDTPKVPYPFFMIASCPSENEGFEDTIDVQTEHAPVTSLYTGLTYKNISYAKCNADFQHLMIWNITFRCNAFEMYFYSGKYFAEINSAEDIVTYINAGVCELRYEITHQDIPRPAPCGGIDFYKRMSPFKKINPIITSCNTSSLWNKFDWNIDYACRTFSQNSQKLRSYQNIYCFMCNRGLAYKYFKDKPIISDCGNTPNDTTIPAKISDACLSVLQTDYNLPFKNIYCKLCFDYKTFKFYNANYTTWLSVDDISEEFVFNAYKKLIRSTDVENNELYINASFSWNITYNQIMYKCLFPRNGLDFLPVCRSGTKPLFQYNCSSNKTYFITGNEYSPSDEDVSRFDDHNFLMQFLLDIYLCHKSVMDNDLCEIDASTNMCSLEVNVDGNNKHLGCLFCTAGFYKAADFWYSGVRILIKVTCPIIPEASLFPDVSSFLQAAVEECEIMIVPSGVTDREYITFVLEYDECIDFPFIDKVTCQNTMIVSWGSYRQLFSISRNDLAVLQNSKHLELTRDVWCAPVDSFVAVHPNATQICRNVSCSVNHVFENGTCKVRQENVSYNQYRLHLLLQVDQNDNQQSVSADEPCLECPTYQEITTIQICEDIGTNIIEHLEQTNENTKLSLTECHVHIQQHACDNDVVDISSDLQMRVTLTFTIELTFSMSDVETHLIDSLSDEYVLQTCDNCHRRLFPVPEGYMWHELASECTFKFLVNQTRTLSAVLTEPVDVNHLLKCPQIELFDDEYTICESKNCIILKANAKQLGVYYYELKNGTARVCLDDLLDKPVTSWKVTLLQTVYKTVDNVCTILSLVCLSVTFITYCLLPDIRNIPGYNNMNLIFSLFWAQFTLKFGIWQPTTSFLCPLFGILIHYFWMSTFCAMNVCSFHMYTVFSGFVNPMHATKRIVYHMSYTYITPCAVIILTVAVHLILSEGSSFGYGDTICFITEPITSIVTFIVPCVLIFLANIIFFVKTFLSIRNSLKNSLVRNSVERSEFLIYVRLWTLLGIAWPLLIVDAMFEISVFSFVALSFNTLQCVFIFISYVCKQRVLDLYRARFNCKISNEQNDQSSSSIKDSRHKLTSHCAGRY